MAINSYKRDNMATKLPQYLQPQQYYKDPVTAYGNVISLPSTVVKGEIKVGLKGQTATNLVKNGNFANGTTGWGVYAGSTLSVNNGVLSVIGDGSSGVAGVLQSIKKTLNNTKWNSKVLARVTNSNATEIKIIIRDGTAGTVFKEYLISNPIINTWYDLSDVTLFTADTINNAHILIRHTYADAATANGKVMEVQEVMAIDMTAMFGAGNEPTKEQCDLMFPHYFDATKSTLPVSVKSVGKNLFDKSKSVFNGHRINESNGTLHFQNDARGYSDYIKVAPDTMYRTNEASETVRNYAWYDANKLFISGGTFFAPGRVSPSNAAFLRVTPGTIELNEIIQIEAGYTRTPYEPYTETQSYNPNIILRSVPNGTQDEYGVDGKWVQRAKEYVLQASDVLFMTTNNTNVDYARMLKPLDSVGYNNLLTDWSILSGYPELKSPPEIFNSANNIGKVCSNAGALHFLIGVAKGTTLEQARTALAGTKLTYQLANPIITYYPPQPLSCTPSGTLYIEPKIGYQLDEYSGGIAIENTDALIETMDYCYKLNTTTGEYIDVLADVVVAVGGLSFTVTGAVDGEYYEYGYEYPQELSTVPVTEYKTPLGLTLPVPLSAQEDIFAPVFLGTVRRLDVWG